MKVLVIDDSLLARKSIIKIFKEHEPGAVFIEAENGEKGLAQYIKEEPIDLVFLDLTMPVMDGFDTLENLLKINPALRVVIVSADIQPKAKERVMGLGAKAMIAKPISKDKMQELLIGGLI